MNLIKWYIYFFLGLMMNIKPPEDADEWMRIDQCEGLKQQLIHMVQMSRIYSDSKAFVDMKMLHPIDQIKDDFGKFMEVTKNAPSKPQLKSFVETHYSPDQDLEPWFPDDYNPEPSILTYIDDLEVRYFAKYLITLWLTLAKKVRLEVSSDPERHTIILLKNGFIIPGGRYREQSYWDSYWIIKGLLISDMTTTVRGMLDNYAAMINRYGHIPSGSRTYLLTRSQPPLLTLMADIYIEATNNIFWIQKNIKALDKELRFWLDHKTITVPHGDRQYTMAHYQCYHDLPRLDAYADDVNACAEFDCTPPKLQCYANIQSTAESGWIFSSRWFTSEGGRSSSKPQRVIPVDLNAFLCKAFKLLSQFYEKINDFSNAAFWRKKYETWMISIDVVLYNKKDGIWYDFDMIDKKQKQEFYPSNFAPLWAEIYHPSLARVLGKSALQYLTKKGIMNYAGGIPSSLKETGEHWDFPNACPAMQSLVVMGLYRSDYKEAQQVAKGLAKNWIAANIKGLMETGHMHEIYDCRKPGKVGGGDSCQVQKGFGWTNGVALELIECFYVHGP